jgi:hypothetical protein
VPIDNAYRSPQQGTSSDSIRPFESCGREVNTKTDVTHERIWTGAEVAAMLCVSDDTVIRRFRSEPGVLLIPGPSGRYQTLRIPDSVLKRVLQKFTVGSDAANGADSDRKFQTTKFDIASRK